MPNPIIKEIPLPINSSWAERLRFYCQTAEPEEPSLSYMVSMWSFCLRNDGLTEAQIKTIRPYLHHRMVSLGITEEADG